jgi:hypothetical protein
MSKVNWFLYSDQAAWSGNSFSEGIKQLGQDFKFRNPMCWTDDDFRACDIAVIFGFRESQQACIRSNISRGIPTVIVDLGYIDRFDGLEDNPNQTLQVSIGDHLNIIPNSASNCLFDRFEKLNIRYPGKINAPDGYALFCGQWPGDTAHPFKDELSIREFINEIRVRIPDIEVKYRTHPRLISSKIDKKSIEEDFEGARCILTYNSNSGHDALREGMPIFCHTDAVYANLGSDLLKNKELEKRIKNPPFPTEDRWTDYFTRLAYGQWSFDELKTGDCQKFILNELGML